MSMEMDKLFPKTFRLKPKSKVPFKCIRCGQCCRNINLQVPLESLDMFRIAKYLRDMGEDIACIDDFLERYAEPAMIDECGYFVYFLKTQGADNVCVFLEDNRCKIHSVNPRACRTYPFIAGPEPEGGYGFFVSFEREHHFKGSPIQVKTWMKSRFTQFDREFLNVDYSLAKRIAELLKKVPKEEKTRAVLLFHICKYGDFDLDKPFQTQFERNQQRLLEALQRMTEEGE